MMWPVLHRWFAEPRALALLLVLPALGVLAWLARLRRRRAFARWGGWSALATARAEARTWRFLRAGLRTTGVALLAVAVAGPRWGRDWNPSPAPGRDLVVLLDMSRSMRAQDVIGRSSPDRLGRAVDALYDLADEVQRHGGHRLGLVVFGARAKVLCPLTHDYDHFRETLANLDSDAEAPDIGPDPREPVSGTRIGEGFRAAVRAHDPRFRGHQDVLMISDGDDPAGDGEWVTGVDLARQQGIPVSTVGVGDPERGSPIPLGDGGYLHYKDPLNARAPTQVLTRLEEKPLQEIARLTGGVYVPARTRALPLGELFRERIEPLAAHENADDPLLDYRPRYAWFLAGALLCLALDVALGDGRPRKRGPGQPSRDGVPGGGGA
jgi:Ca-activated chloride channel family protein